jgi:hypothetical protein
MLVAAPELIGFGFAHAYNSYRTREELPDPARSQQQPGVITNYVSGAYVTHDLSMFAAAPGHWLIDRCSGGRTPTSPAMWRHRWTEDIDYLEVQREVIRSLRRPHYAVLQRRAESGFERKSGR